MTKNATTPTTRSRRQVERWNGLQFIEMGEFKKKKSEIQSCSESEEKTT